MDKKELGDIRGKLEKPFDLTGGHGASGIEMEMDVCVHQSWWWLEQNQIVQEECFILCEEALLLISLVICCNRITCWS